MSCLLALGACDSDGSDGASDTEAVASSGDEGEAGESENPSGANNTSGPSGTTDPSSADVSVADPADDRSVVYITANYAVTRLNRFGSLSAVDELTVIVLDRDPVDFIEELCL